jgi:hypothetical protein
VQHPPATSKIASGGGERERKQHRHDYSRLELEREMKRVYDETLRFG